MNVRKADAVCRAEVLLFCPGKRNEPRCRKGMDRDAAKEWTASTPTERVVTGNRGSTAGEGNMVVLKEGKKKRQCSERGLWGIDLALLGCSLVREKVCSFADG